MGKCKSEHKAREYEALRNKGYTYDEIAAVAGCSRQNICWCLARYKASQFRGFDEKRCIFPGLRKWLNENKCSLSELLRKIYDRNPANGTHKRFARMLSGKTALIMRDINLILKATGCTYEELFLEGESND